MSTAVFGVGTWLLVLASLAVGQPTTMPLPSTATVNSSSSNCTQVGQDEQLKLLTTMVNNVLMLQSQASAAQASGLSLINLVEAGQQDVKSAISAMQVGGWDLLSATKVT